MPRLLTELLSAGLIDKLDGDDSRYEKMEKAADALAGQFTAEPRRLIGAVLAGLDPEVGADDPAMAAAEAALVEQWMSVRSVHRDPPIHVLRALLLDAAVQAAEGPRAAIVWLTAADMLRFARLGREEAPVRAALARLAEAVERLAQRPMDGITLAPPPEMRQSKVDVGAPMNRHQVDREALKSGLADVVASAANRNYHHLWVHDFAPKMAPILADEVDALHERLSSVEARLISSMARVPKAISHDIREVLVSQHRWLLDLQSSLSADLRARTGRIDTLWWAESLYSPSLRTGYRALLPIVASIAMAADLVSLLAVPCAASVGYLLAETVGRLPGVSFTERKPVLAWLTEMCTQRDALPESWRGALGAPLEGRRSLRDLAVDALHGRAELRDTLIRPDDAITLPELAHAIFRQEQGRRVAEAET